MMQFFFHDTNLSSLRTIALDKNEDLQKRIAAMELIREFEQKFAITFGVDKKIE